MVPRTQRSVLPAMRSIVRFDDALQSRGPSLRMCSAALGPGSALQRSGALQLVRDTNTCSWARVQRRFRRWGLRMGLTGRRARRYCSHAHCPHREEPA